MNRIVYLNDVDNVHMYAVESGTNANNCADSCGGCNPGGGNSGGSDEVAQVITDVVIVSVDITIQNPMTIPVAVSGVALYL